LAVTRGHEHQAKPPKPPKPQLDPESEAARQIKGLVTRNQNLDRKYQRTLALLEKKALVLPRKVSSAIDFVVQPDQRGNVDEERLDKACRVWNAWRDDLRKAGREEREEA
jgi:hypothetical protein